MRDVAIERVRENQQKNPTGRSGYFHDTWEPFERTLVRWSNDQFLFRELKEREFFDEELKSTFESCEAEVHAFWRRIVDKDAQLLLDSVLDEKCYTIWDEKASCFERRFHGDPATIVSIPFASSLLSMLYCDSISPDSDAHKNLSEVWNPTVRSERSNSYDSCYSYDSFSSYDSFYSADLENSPTSISSSTTAKKAY